MLTAKAAFPCPFYKEAGRRYPLPACKFLFLSLDDFLELERVAVALIESACHGRVVGRGIHDKSTDQAFEHFGLLKSVADRSGIGGTGAVDGVNDPVDSVVAEQALGFHADAVFLGNTLTESLSIGRVEADTGDIHGIIANEMGVHMKVTSGPAIEKPGEMAAILNNLQEGDILFVDEIHRLNRQVEEVLYPAMEDYAIDIMIGKGASARSIRLDLPKFTLVGATTRAGLLSAPLRDRFGVMHHLEFYTHEELKTIIIRSAQVLGVEIDEKGAAEIAKRSRGTPRLANRLLKRVRDFAQVKYDGRITYNVACFALNLLEVDQYGLDKIDRRILQTMIVNFQGGPVGLETLAAAIGEDSGTLEDVHEPYLLQNGFLNRTPRGRMASALAYEHLGYQMPEKN